MCTKNYDQMMYGSWDMVRDRCNCYFSFWAIFCPFIPLTCQKIKILQKWKKSLEISSFYICVPKIMIKWCTVLEIWCTTDGRRAGWKKWHIEMGAPPKKKPGDIIILHMFTINYDQMMYSFWDMVVNGRMDRQMDTGMDEWIENVTYRGGCPT